MKEYKFTTKDNTKIIHSDIPVKCVWCECPGICWIGKDNKITSYQNFCWECAKNHFVEVCEDDTSS